MRHTLGGIAFAALALSSFCAAAQTYYKWVDTHGATHYEERPPMAIKARKVELHGGIPIAAPAPSASVASTLPANEKAYRTQACASARRDLEVLSSGAMVIGGGTMGDPVDLERATKLSPEQREAAKVEANKHVHDFCGPG